MLDAIECQAGDGPPAGAPTVPLFYHERHVEFFQELFHGLGAKVVINFTPGGGVGVRAAMLSSLPS
eukprot:10425518-Alexandrium_andersonii.AAC.1